MVWPILISVAVTPRISAAFEISGHVSRTSAPIAPNFMTKRIDVLPLVSRLAHGRARRHGLIHALARKEACHEAMISANHYGDGLRVNRPAAAQQKTRRRRRVFR